MSSTDAVETEAVASDTDPEAEALLDRLRSALGDDLVESHTDGGLHWVRVRRDAWADLANFLHNQEGFGFFSFLSAIDWMPSPFGRDMDSAVDNVLDPPEPKEPPPTETGVAGGDTRFQLLARVSDAASGRSIIAKADLPTDDLRAPSWVPVYPGADWHEREAWEMFGIDFDGHPGLRHIYLPGEFEGHPLRKDYPLLARRVKPWPGLVDVELMPEADDKDGPP
ncbi:MAG: NADH-quinone oxidoreductase subunit C [Acidimicrobiaceae bacterium]|nr:NADH-quinone oxidoreductase subunit C [Acidimicrobiaceae bacterium]